MNRYNDTSKQIAEDFILTTFQRYLDYVRNGLSDLTSIWHTEGWDTIIHDALEREWNNLYDVEENTYWRLENVTGHDKSLAFHKLKRTVETALHEMYQRELSNHIDQMKSEGDDMWITFVAQVHNASGNNFRSRYLELAESA